MDEWDSIFFNSLFTDADRFAFLMFLKQLLKTKPYVELAYLTGILPIAKHSTGSDLICSSSTPLLMTRATNGTSALLRMRCGSCTSVT